MKRYFQILGRQKPILLDLRPPASTLTAEELSAELRLPLHELARFEYERLMKLFV